MRGDDDVTVNVRITNPRGGEKNVRIVAVCLLALLAAACTAPTQPFHGPDPSDPQVQVSAVGYRSTIGSYTSQRPVEPLPWREQNERVAPRLKSGQ